MKTLKVLKVTQPLGEFYIGAIDARDLLGIATIDVREFELGNPGEIDGLQRELSPTRLKALRDYVNLDYATFPTSVILAIDGRCVELKDIANCDGLYDLVIDSFAGTEDEPPIPIDASAFVIDGQHRLAGLAHRKWEKGPFEVNVSIFVGADIADQAEIFSRVNLAQTKVNPSLTYDLLDYAKEKSPFKVAHDITVALNRDPSGPFFEKIKRLGVRTPGVDGEKLAQATVVNGLLRHLPKDQEKERSKSLWGLGARPEPRERWQDRIFVQFYRDDDVVSILLNVSNYFSAVRKKWEWAWESEDQGQILGRTTGYNALIRFLQVAFVSIVERPRVVSIDEFYEVFDRVTLDPAGFTSDKYLPGSSGASLLYKELVDLGLPGDKKTFLV